MSIRFDAQRRAFFLSTPHSVYQMVVSPADRLLHPYYGGTVSDFAEQIMPRGGHSSFHVGDKEEEDFFAPDLYPAELGLAGLGDYRVTTLRIRTETGSACTDARYRSHTVTPGKPMPQGLPGLFCTSDDDADTLTVELQDPATGVLITLYYTVFRHLDAIVRRMRITNPTEKPIWIEDAKSACVDLTGDDFDLISLVGDYARERIEERHPISSGIEEISSTRGASGHCHNPFVALARHGAGEESGEVYGAALIYSGSFAIQTEVNATKDTRLVLGLNDRDFRWELNPGETFDTPEAVLVYSDTGLGGMSRTFHRLFNHHLISPKWTVEKRPLLINSWEAAFFRFDEEKLYDFAVRAKEMGIEMLVMDDGWFGQRNDDHRSLGDWYVNENKLHGGLAKLVDRVHALGLKFGIWYEPEMISPDSDLYRAHPDWCLHTKGRKQAMARYQYVLDFSNPAVVDHIWEQMTAVLDTCKIDYVKWDYNRNFSEASSDWLDADHQCELAHRCMLGTYDLQSRLLARYPDLLLENCSGGGGRFDGGMLYYSPQIWCSDNTDPVDRLFIQFGTSLCYPASCVGAHVSASPRASLITKGIVAAWGTNGYELDPNRYTEEERELVREQVADYHRYYDLIHDGDLYRLVRPQEYKGYCAWEFVSPDKSQALVSVVNLTKQTTCNRVLKIAGLDPEKQYLCEAKFDRRNGCRINGMTLHGDTLAKVGVNLSMCDFHDYAAMQLLFTEVK